MGFYYPFNGEGPATVQLCPSTTNQNDTAQVVSDSFTQAQFEPSLIGELMFGANSGEYRMWFGYFDSDPSQTDSPSNGFGFLVSPSKGKNIQAVSCSNGSCTYTDTGLQGIFQSLSQLYNMTMVMASNGTSMSFTVTNVQNKTITATKIITADIPGAINLKMFASITKLSNLNEQTNIMFPRIYGESN